MNQIRIIGGKWRGRKLTVLDSPGLRPTPNRVRETLFNWLAPVITDARCLDVFAGSGALGFEALSRGASNVVMIDSSPAVIKTLHNAATLLNAKNIEIHCAIAPTQLTLIQGPFDIIFLDPPFQKNNVLPCCHFLEENNFCAENTLIYIESSEKIDEKQLPKNWTIIKNKKAGRVVYHLIERHQKEPT